MFGDAGAGHGGGVDTGDGHPRTGRIGKPRVRLAVAHREFAAQEGQGIRHYLKPSGLLFDLKYVVQDGGADARL